MKMTMNRMDDHARGRVTALFRRAVRLLLGAGTLHAATLERPVEPLARVLFEQAAALSLELVEEATRRMPDGPTDAAVERARAMVPALSALAERSPDLTLESERIRHDLEELFRALCPARSLNALLAA